MLSSSELEASQSTGLEEVGASATEGESESQQQTLTELLQEAFPEETPDLTKTISTEYSDTMELLVERDFLTSEILKLMRDNGDIAHHICSLLYNLSTTSHHKKEQKTIVSLITECSRKHPQQIEDLAHLMGKIDHYYDAEFLKKYVMFALQHPNYAKKINELMQESIRQRPDGGLLRVAHGYGDDEAQKHFKKSIEQLKEQFKRATAFLSLFGQRKTGDDAVVSMSPEVGAKVNPSLLDRMALHTAMKLADLPVKPLKK